MSSTEFRIGLDGTRSSSKVLKPPGGDSSDIFGTGSQETSKHNTNTNSNTKDRLFASTPETNPTPTKQNQGISNIFGNASNEMARSAKKKYVHRNPITGEEIVYNMNENKEENCNTIDNSEISETAEEPTVKPVQTSIRVRNPPGGKSTGIF